MSTRTKGELSRAFVGVGSNIDPQIHIPRAIEMLRALAREVALSPVYRCPAVGFDGPAFLNMVVAVDVDIDAFVLAEKLREIEQQCGRDRSQPGKSRTMDLDLLLYDDLVSDAPELRIPRDDIDRYAFVLKPLADLNPAGLHPVHGRSFAQLWQAFDAHTALQRVDLPLG